MDNRLMDPVYRAGGRPGSDRWWMEREGVGNFSKKRNVSWKNTLFAVVGVLVGVGLFLAALLAMTG